MTDERIERGEPDLTEVIDITTLPSWDEPKVRQMFAKIDEFLMDPSIGVRRERPQRRVDPGKHEACEDPNCDPGKHEACEDPNCVDGYIALDVTTPGGMLEAVEYVESTVMGGFLAYYAIDIENDEAGASDLLDRIMSYLHTVPPKVLIGVILSLGETGAAMYLALEERNKNV